MRSVAALNVRSQAMAQTLTVASPRLEHLALETIEQMSVAADETRVQEATCRRPRAARVSSAFGEGPYARLEADGLFPEWVAHRFGDPRQSELAVVQKQELGIAARRQLASAVCAERHQDDRAAQPRGQPPPEARE